MTGTAKWLIVGSVVIIAITALVTLGFFVWMMSGGAMMSGVNTPWSMATSRGFGSTGMGSWRGMMDDFGSGSTGMMGDLSNEALTTSGILTGDDFTLEVVEERLEDYLAGQEDLEIGEIMIFDNHAYAQLVESDSGIGAMEVLVDPFTLSVTPEHGPNMMWNQKYGGMHGGRMMGFGSTEVVDGEMPISAEKAVEFAQAYLDLTISGTTADEHADPFYGYYTIHTLSNGEVIGMLSINGYTGRVFPHTWHGELLSMSADEGHG